MYMGWGGACVSTYVYGDFVSPNPGRPPCKLACRPSCKLTLSGYGISYRRRRKGDRGGFAVWKGSGKSLWAFMDRCKSVKTLNSL